MLCGVHMYPLYISINGHTMYYIQQQQRQQQKMNKTSGEVHSVDSTHMQPIALKHENQY